MKALPKQVRVEWTDATTYNCDYNGGKLCMTAASVGYLVHKGKDELHIVQNIWENGDKTCCIAIPRRWVKRIVELRE